MLGSVLARWPGVVQLANNLLQGMDDAVHLLQQLRIHSGGAGTLRL